MPVDSITLQDDRSALNLDCVAVHNHLYVVGTFLLGTRVSPLLLWIGSVVGRMGRPHFDFALSSRAGRLSLRGGGRGRD